MTSRDDLADDLIWDWINDRLDHTTRQALEQDAQALAARQAREAQLAALLLEHTRAPSPHTSPRGALPWPPAKAAPGQSRRDALRAAIAQTCRFEDFAPQVASLLDLPDARALEYLRGIDSPGSWEQIPLPGISLYHLEGGPRVARAITGFVKIEPGAVFPAHEHVGPEQALVLQGTMLDSRTGAHRRGALVHMDEDTEHLIEAAPGVPLIYLTIVQTGIKLFGVFIDHESELM